MKLNPALVAALLEGPALPYPGGSDGTWQPTVHSRDQLWYYVCVSLCTAFSGIFIILRLYTKLRVVHKLDLSDYLILLSFALLAAEVGIGRPTLNHGAGVHQWHIKVKDLFELLKWMNYAEILYGPTIFVVKMSILVQYLRMLAPNRTVNPFMFWGSWIIISTSFTFYTIDTFITIFACNPREKIWNKLRQEGHCMNYNAVVLATGYFNIISDVAILLLPVRSVWQLSIPLRKKVAISFLFATGLLACIASAMRIVETLAIVHKPDTSDVSYHIAWMGLWSYAEIALGIIVACTLSLPKLVQAKGWKLPSVFSSFSNPFSSNKTNPTLPTWHSHSEKSAHGGGGKTVNTVIIGQTLSQTDLTFETGSYQLKSSSSRDGSERS
ncbi:uncharacterized protein BDR25DRAFT_95504 [Lindgomyces ingoldianus]|uniref:Uncharacterized protein n=1 Tax=Lindgomyces ingoldianus TaxID=673940 RepID=A0ACB6QEL2_9PLEO|nr:uncharacterized protein BDR25DRAFT_95504 [Lindgomyces ingoldianus]KAF2464557.1 hypothetical protein BDR25DRAFT_95504 [Lindgomyces ingoldianus]